MSDYILVIDDDDDMRALLVDVLQGIGMPIRCARDGNEGLNRIKQDPPALVLLDLVMPQMTGWDFVRRIETDAGVKGLPVVVITSFYIDERLLSSLDLPPERVIQKPDNLLDLREPISALLKSFAADKTFPTKGTGQLKTGTDVKRRTNPKPRRKRKDAAKTTKTTQKAEDKK